MASHRTACFSMNAARWRVRTGTPVAAATYSRASPPLLCRSRLLAGTGADSPRFRLASCLSFAASRSFS